MKRIRKQKVKRKTTHELHEVESEFNPVRNKEDEAKIMDTLSKIDNALRSAS